MKGHVARPKSRPRKKSDAAGSRCPISIFEKLAIAWHKKKTTPLAGAIWTTTQYDFFLVTFTSSDLYDSRRKPFTKKKEELGIKSD